MRRGRLLFSAVECAIVAALFIAGLGVLILHFSPEARQALGEWMLEAHTSLLPIAIFVLIVASLCAICFAAMQKGGYVHLKARGCSIEEALVRNATLAFWREELSHEPLPSEVYCSFGTIKIVVPSLKNPKEIENRLGPFLAQQLGYERDFTLSLTIS